MEHGISTLSSGSHPGTWLLLWWSSLFCSLLSAASAASFSRRGEGASATPKRDDVICEACVCLEPQALVVFRGDQEQGTQTCLSQMPFSDTEGLRWKREGKKEAMEQSHFHSC